MHSAVCGEAGALSRLVPSAVLFYFPLIPLLLSPLLCGRTLFFIYNEKIMFEIFTRGGGGGRFNKA